MNAIFLQILNMSIAASWVILAVLLLRLPMRKAPRWLGCLLWVLVALRLVLPDLPKSNIGLLPSGETIPTTLIEGSGFQVQSGVTVIDRPVNEYLSSRYYEGVTVPAGHGAQVMTVLGYVWLVGVVLMLAYMLFSYLRIRRQVAVSAKIEKQVYICDAVTSPFILGVLSPRIYLPSAMTEGVGYVLAHERSHLSRWDHLWKPIGFVLLSIHWFNPLVWVGYILLCRDIELACDEKVVKALDAGEKKQYSLTLLQFSARQRSLTVCPLAFGEVGVKERVKKVLSYKKPTLWIIVAAVLVCALAAVLLLTSPKNEGEPPAIDPVTDVAADPETDGTDTNAIEPVTEPNTEPATEPATESNIDIYIDQAVLTEQELDLEEQQLMGKHAALIGEQKAMEASFPWKSIEITNLEAANTGTAGLNEAITLYRIFLTVNGKGEKEGQTMTVTDHYIAMMRVWNEEATVFYCLGSIDEATVDALYGTPEMLARYGNKYTAAAMEMKGAYLDREEGPIMSQYARIHVLGSENIWLNLIEFITDKDTERIAELGLTAFDMPNGYYIHDPEETVLQLNITEETVFKFFDWWESFTDEKDPRYSFADRWVTTSDPEVFAEYLSQYGKEPAKFPFIYERDGDTLISITEIWVP